MLRTFLRPSEIGSVADPGSVAFLTPRSGMGQKNQDPDHISESSEKIFGLKILEFFDVDSNSGSGIQDGKIRIWVKYPGSATLEM